MLRGDPFWFRIWMVFCLVLGIATVMYTFKECGAKSLLLGNSSVVAAVTGMCDQ